MHLNEEQTHRLVDGELDVEMHAAVREHLLECETCRRQFAAAESDANEVNALLRHVDHPQPDVTAGRIARAARAPKWRANHWAAGIVGALGLAGVAYAAVVIPASTVARWVDTVAGWFGDEGHQGAGATRELSEPGDRGTTGVAILPGQSFVIRFTSPVVQGEALVSLTDHPELEVRTRQGMATFSSDVDRLDVQAAPNARFEILIPREAPYVQILTGSARIFLKDGTRLVPDTTARADGSYRFFLGPRAPE